MPPMGPDRPAHGEGVPRDLEIEGDIAYIANEWGLILIDIADPANPRFVGDIRIGEGAEATNDVAVSQVDSIWDAAERRLANSCSSRRASL
jgi:hypothetical protein